MWNWIESLIAAFRGQEKPAPTAPTAVPEAQKFAVPAKPPEPLKPIAEANPMLLELQQRLQHLGFMIVADGVWGAQTTKAVADAIELDMFGVKSLAWGTHVSAEFRALVMYVAEQLSASPDHLMAVVAFETGESFSASVKNPRSSATGLIQFMEGTAKGLGTTTALLAQMTAEQQLSYVFRHLYPYRGRLQSLSDCYMAVLRPAAVGTPDSQPFPWTAEQYRLNSGLDADRDGQVTKAEAAAMVSSALHRGLVPPNVWISQ